MKDQVLSQAEIDALFAQVGQTGPEKASFPDLSAGPKGGGQTAQAAPAAPAPPARQVQAAPPPHTAPAVSIPGGTLPISLLSDVELEITVQLGQTTRSIREILEMGPGHVMELDRLAGDAVDILVNGRLVARAEVVVIGDNFGVRITELIKPEGGNG